MDFSPAIIHRCPRAVDSFKGERSTVVVVGDRPDRTVSNRYNLLRGISLFFLAAQPPSPTGGRSLVNLWLRLTGFLMNTGDFEGVGAARDGRIFADRVHFSPRIFSPEIYVELGWILMSNVES